MTIPRANRQFQFSFPSSFIPRRPPLLNLLLQLIQRRVVAKAEACQVQLILHLINLPPSKRVAYTQTRARQLNDTPGHNVAIERTRDLSDRLSESALEAGDLPAVAPQLSIQLAKKSKST